MKLEIKNSIILLFGMLAFASCSNMVEETITYKVNEPLYMSADEFRKSVRVTSSTPIEKQGKIAFYDDYLFISEPEKGIHIIDNKNPKSPKQTGFIELLGNVDMAIKDNILYADSYIDLVWFDISNPAVPVLKGRIEEAFPQALPQPDNGYYCDYNPYNDKDKGIVVGWKVEEKNETYWRENNWFWQGKYDGFTGISEGSANSSNMGRTGSMARFAIYEDFLYTVLNNELGVFNIETGKPQKAGENFNVGWEVETVFSYKTNLFMGTPTGMIIYSVEDPLKPTYRSAIQHVYGCDPVVVENDIAYVTVHSGNNCGQNNNQLIIVDVKDVVNPKAIVTYEMTNPKGLGIDNNTLFVCDDGLKVFDAANPLTIMAKENMLAHKHDMDGYDLIAFNNVLMMIAADGIYQYDYSNLRDIKLLSKIAIIGDSNK